MNAGLPDRFILYRRTWDETKGKWNKLPCDVRGGNINPHDPQNWKSLEEVTPHATWDEKQPSAPYGIGFVLNGDGWWLYDLDNCRDDNGNWQPWAETAFLSFTGALGEISTSGRGLHVLGKCNAQKLQDRRHKWGKDQCQEQEWYQDKRFVALSKDGLTPIGGEYTDKDWTDQLLRLVPQLELLGDLPEGRDPTYSGPENDDDLTAKILDSRSGAGAFGGVTVKDLWEANAQALGQKWPSSGGSDGFDHSSADAALAAHLAFWTGRDLPRMDRLFRRSGLMRDKWDRKTGKSTYGRMTLEKAARLCEKVYSKSHLTLPGLEESPSGEGEVWEPLPSMFTNEERLPPPELDLHSFFPSELAQWIEDAARSKSAPKDYVAFGLLAASASLIGNARRAVPQQGWQQPTALWVMCIGNPSCGKSPALDAVREPLQELERPLKKKAQEDWAKWKDQKTLADLAETSWKKQVKEALAESKQPPAQPDAMRLDPEPHIPSLVIGDATIEKLALICALQPKGILQHRDELTGWLQGFQRYSNGTDKPFWLEAYGGRPYTVERVGREAVVVPQLLISVLGGIQPDKLESQAIKTEDDGFLARFLPIWPDTVPLEHNTNPVDNHTVLRIFQKLHGLKMGEDQNGDLSSIGVGFDPDAERYFFKLRTLLKEQGDQSSGLYASFLGKLPGVAATLCLLNAFLRWAATSKQAEPHRISVPDVEAAERLTMDYIIPMAQRVYAAYSLPPNLREAVFLLGVIRKHGWPEFTRRQLQRFLGNKYQSREALERQLKELEEAGAIRDTTKKPGSAGGRPSVSYTVNPHVHDI